jgi:hypothetical protein
MKELIEAKGSPNQCLDEGNTSQHLPLPVRAYKRECGSGLALSRLHHIVQARAPMKNEKEKLETDHSIHCE